MAWYAKFDGIDGESTDRSTPSVSEIVVTKDTEVATTFDAATTIDGFVWGLDRIDPLEAAAGKGKYLEFTIVKAPYPADGGAGDDLLIGGTTGFDGSSIDTGDFNHWRQNFGAGGAASAGGHPGGVNVLFADGSVKFDTAAFELFAYDRGFSGGVSVAVGDIDGDGSGASSPYKLHKIGYTSAGSAAADGNTYQGTTVVVDGVLHIENASSFDTEFAAAGDASQDKDHKNWINIEAVGTPINRSGASGDDMPTEDVTFLYGEVEVQYAEYGDGSVRFLRDSIDTVGGSVGRDLLIGGAGSDQIDASNNTGYLIVGVDDVDAQGPFMMSARFLF